MGTSRAQGLHIVVAGPWNPSSDSRFYRRVAADLVEQGVRVTYLADCQPASRQPGDESFGIEVSPTRSFRTRADVRWAVNRMRGLKPDLVLGRFCAGTTALLAGRAAGVKNRVHVHSTSIEATRLGWPGSAGAFRARTARTAVIMRLATAHVALSAGAADEVAEVYRLRRGMFHVMPIGIAAPAAVLPAAERSHDIVCVGRLTEAKGQRDLMRAVSGSGRHLLLVGDGPDRQLLERLAARYDVDVAFAGVVPAAAARDMVGRAKASVLLTRAEAYSLAVLESLAAGTPVISTASDGPSALLRDGVDGFIVDPTDPDVVRQRLVDVQGTTWEQMSAACVQRFNQIGELARCSTAAARWLIDTASA